MTDAMGKLAAGDHAVEVPAVGRKDEVGQMADAVQTFKDAAIEKVRLEAEAAEQRRATEDERKAAEAERAATAEAAGPGGRRPGPGPGAAGGRRSDLPPERGLRAELREAARRLQRGHGAAAADDRRGGRQHRRHPLGLDEISQASDDLSRRTEQQAASLEETAAALDEITATVRKTAEGARPGPRRGGLGAKADAERSGDGGPRRGRGHERDRELRPADQPDHRRDRRDRLPDQPAGPERRRRGGPGRRRRPGLRGGGLRGAGPGPALGGGGQGDQGADLGLRASRWTAGVNLVGETGKALERIVAQVAEINGVVAEIAASAQEQATGLQQVNTAVNQMDQVTQQNAAMVEAVHRRQPRAGQRGRRPGPPDLPLRARRPARQAPARPRRAAAPAPRPSPHDEDHRPSRRRRPAPPPARRRQLGRVLSRWKPPTTPRGRPAGPGRQPRPDGGGAPGGRTAAPPGASPRSLDASGVQRLGAQCLQVLLAARALWSSDGQPWRLVDPSPEFADAAALMGCPHLALADACRTDPMSMTVLTVDDSRTMREMLRLALDRRRLSAWCRPRTACTGWRSWPAEAPDVIVTDINMPRMDGFGFIEEVRSDPHYRGVPILVLTTESDAEKKNRARMAGATGWIVKPFNPVKLVDAIRRVAA